MISLLTCNLGMGLGHSYSECKDPITRPDKTPQERTSHMTCRRYLKKGHSKRYCKEPFCKKCDTITHTLDKCPHKMCNKCDVNTHWFGENCPMFKKRMWRIIAWLIMSTAN